MGETAEQTDRRIVAVFHDLYGWGIIIVMIVVSSYCCISYCILFVFMLALLVSVSLPNFR